MYSASMSNQRAAPPRCPFTLSLHRPPSPDTRPNPDPSIDPPLPRPGDPPIPPFDPGPVDQPGPIDVPPPPAQAESRVG